MRAALGLLVASVALAGCIGDDVTDPLTDDGSDGMAVVAEVLPWGLYDCSFANVFVPLAEEDVRPFIPEEFEIVGSSDPIRGLTGTSYIGLETFICDSGEGHNETVQDMHYGSWFTRVAPPPELTLEGVETYYYKWEVLVPDEARRTLFQDRGMPAFAGEGTLLNERVPTGTGGGTARVTLDGAGTAEYAFTTGQTNGFSGPGGAFGEFTPLEDGGYAVWKSNYTVHHIDGLGLGAVQVSEGSMPSAMIGGTVAQGQLIAGLWTFHDGWVGFVGPGESVTSLAPAW